MTTYGCINIMFLLLQKHTWQHSQTAFLRHLSYKPSFPPGSNIKTYLCNTDTGMWPQSWLSLFFLWHCCGPTEPCRQQPRVSLENDDLLCLLKYDCKQTYLASCLPCNNPDPSTVSTAPLRDLVNVLMKDTWAVCSFLVWMLSPPSIWEINTVMW